MHAALLAIGIVAGLWLLFEMHARFWGWYLRPRTSPDEVFYVTTEDGARLAIGHHRAKTGRRYLEPVILCHGLAANRFNLDFDDYSLARRLAERGFEAFVLEVRGIGLSEASRREKAKYTFDDFANRDAPVALLEAMRRAESPRAFWVGHSMGGMIGYVLGEGDSAPKLAGLVAIASPATWSHQQYLLPLARLAKRLAAFTWLDRRTVYAALAPLAGHFQPKAARLIARTENIDGRVARRLVAHNTAPIHPGVIKQFADWIERDRFSSADGERDYRAGLSHFRAPVLLLVGSDDRMAPPAAIAEVNERIGSADKTLLFFGTPHGHSADYGHGDIVFGRRAPEEVFPHIVRWLESHATLLASPPMAGNEPVASAKTG
jgi:predicted alpha/beta hydrolase